MAWQTGQEVGQGIDDVSNDNYLEAAGHGLQELESGIGAFGGLSSSRASDTTFASGEVQGARIVNSGASDVNAGAALRSKLSALEDAQGSAASLRTLLDGRFRYYDAEVPAQNPGPTRGTSYVTEWNPTTGTVRSWMESYDQAVNVVRVHPKMINGETVNSPHYPPTGKELGQ